jgi:hypothetical protein
MDQKEATIVWSVFEEVAPNLCYIQRTRELLGDQMDKAEDAEDLLGLLGDEQAQMDNPSFKTDLRILRERLDKRSRSRWRDDHVPKGN